MTTTTILNKKSQVVRDVYFDISDDELPVEDLTAEERKLFDSMERFHKLSHSR